MKNFKVGTRIKFKDICQEMHPVFLKNSKSIFVLIDIKQSPFSKNTGELYNEYLFANMGGEHQVWINESRIEKLENFIEILT